MLRPRALRRRARAPRSRAPGCGYPTAAIAPTLAAESARYERIAAGTTEERLPPELACELPQRARAAAARQNARALARVEADLAEGVLYSYSAIATFGFGHRDHAGSAVLGYLPGGACRPQSKEDLDVLSLNVTRAGRAGMAHAARVAPVVIVSGGAVHSPLVEAFALAHLARCRFGVPEDRILVDPCADHTHTNLKHTASLVLALGGRSAYVVTDDGLQAEYLEEDTFWRAIGGDLDQRSLRDWGYLLGSWRRASTGIRAGFWFTPFRFWAEPAAGLGSLACAR
ncbi:MAG: ElyC/SanA/YdcF family protein [Polyangiaceae bacterium]